MTSTSAPEKPVVADQLPRIPLMVTHILEHLYCPRFTYFEYVLGIPERQERRGLVMKGRAVHEERKRINAGYLRKKLGVVVEENGSKSADFRVGVVPEGWTGCWRRGPGIRSAVGFGFGL